MAVSKSTTLVVPYHHVDNAAHALRQAHRWISVRELQRSAVTLALLASLERAAVHLEASLRLGHP